MGKKILVIEDDTEIVRVLQTSLAMAGFDVITASDGRAAIDIFREQSPSLVLLDLRLPKLDGLDVAQHIRRQSDTPIIMLTARVTESDKIRGLKWADDYVTKPFSLQELLARIQCVLRRAQGAAPRPLIDVGALTINLESHEVKLKGKSVPLTPTEFALLALLAQHPGRVFSRWQLLEEIRGIDSEGSHRTIDTHIKNLRRKIEADPAEPRYIVSVYGLGYKFMGGK